LRVRETTSEPSTTALGDWYATRIVARPRHLLLCVSENSRLALVFPAAPLTTLIPRFQEAVRELLQALNMPEAAVAREAREMETITIGPTRNRSVPGTMNEYAKMIYYEEYEETVGTDPNAPLRLSLSLSRIIWSAIAYRRPDDVTRELLEARYEESTNNPDETEP
jgi:hypothetical protein